MTPPLRLIKQCCETIPMRPIRGNVPQQSTCIVVDPNYGGFRIANIPHLQVKVGDLGQRTLLQI